MTRSIAKMVLVPVICLLATAALSLFLVLSGFPWWLGPVLAGIAAGAYLTVHLIRIIVLRRRENRFVAGILNEDGASSRSVGAGRGAVELKRRWKTAVADLRKTNLKQMGNPLYVLPWYLLIGESGSGKTTALLNSGLSTITSKNARVEGTAGTRNCDWWFFEDAVVLDTAGRYTIEQDRQDNREWDVFLQQLKKYRKKEPINGVITTISADKLLTAQTGELESYGRKIGAKVNELMQLLGTRFPVYILVTKCDLIYGMEAFFEYLPNTIYSQAFGHLNKNFPDDIEAFLDEAENRIASGLDKLRLLVTYKPGFGKSSPRIVFFPEEFSKVYARLALFVRAAFKNNVYQEPFLLRGFFFSSASQKHRPYSTFLERLGLSDDTREKEATGYSFFLRDVFAYILPEDRRLSAPTQGALKDKNRLRRWVLATWCLAFVVLAGLMGVSFSRNMALLDRIAAVSPMPMVFNGEPVHDISLLEQYRSELRAIEKAHEDWRLPRSGLHQSRGKLAVVKKNYCRYFRQQFMQSADTWIDGAITRIHEQVNPGNLVDILPFMIRQINLLAALAGDTPPHPGDVSLKDNCHAVLDALGPGPFPEKIRTTFVDQYRDYLHWEDREWMVKTLEKRRSQLNFLIGRKDTTLRWLVAWCGRQPDIADLRSSDFWGGSPSAGDPVIPGAYQLKGMKVIDGLYGELMAALDTPLDMSHKKMAFDQWYRDQYFYQWYQFAGSFENGFNRLQSEEDRYATLRSLGTEDNPYYQFLHRLAREMEPFAASVQDLPFWVQLAFEFENIRLVKQKLNQQNGADAKKVAAGLVRAGATAPGAFIKYAGWTGKLGSLAGNIVTAEQRDHTQTAAKALDAYLQALLTLSETVQSNADAHALVSKAFSADPDQTKTPVGAAMHQEKQLKAYITDRKISDDVFWSLATGPFRTLWATACRKSGLFLQEQWETKVFSKAAGIAGRRQLTPKMFADDGPVSRFVAETLAPFVEKDSAGQYVAKVRAGSSIGFDPAYLAFLGRGEKAVSTAQNSYRVTVTSLPTTLNKGARMATDATELVLACGNGNQKIENFNYPVNKTVTWSPQDCGKVSLSIHIGRVTLKKVYGGLYPFASFLRDFSKGSKVFRRSDFPEHSAMLRKYNITFIKIRYRIKNGRPVIRLANLSTGRIPEQILACSD